MLIGDGVTPGNEGRGYVLRRMMRRTIRNMRILGASDPTSRELVAASIKAMGPQYPELVENQERITSVTVNEEETFLSTLKSGTQILMLLQARLSRLIQISWMAKLYSSFTILMVSLLINFRNGSRGWAFC